MYCSMVDFRNECFADDIEAKYKFTRTYDFNRRHRNNWFEKLMRRQWVHMMTMGYKQGSFVNLWFILTREYWNTGQ